ncbi:hypothetical protein ACJIZ3_008095 [Penstemon smallii]|uniref:Ternary complex factor MIP1 leucine-zipper domain-containing protein n=1 Tax=Penstemon smallii TaxID=265156 RepID=A0ABD3T8T6_9LAMI
MNKRVGTIVNSKKAPLHPQNGKKMEFQRGKSQSTEKIRHFLSSKERKLALLQDVDNLKKKLKDEENIHRALERALNRPLGALPQEVVRLEEQVLNFRQGLFQEALYISSKRGVEDSKSSSNELLNRSSKQRHSRSLSQNEANLGSLGTRASPLLSRSMSSRKFFSSDSRHPQSCPVLTRINQVQKRGVL